MLYSGTDPESYITEYTLVYDDQIESVPALNGRMVGRWRSTARCSPLPQRSLHQLLLLSSFLLSGLELSDTKVYEP